MSQEIQKIFTEISPRYDLVNHLLSFNMDRSWRNKTVDLIEHDPHRPINALDLCAGTLDLSIAFLKKFKKGRVWAVDFSQKMLDEGMTKVGAPACAPLQLKDRIRPLCADALELPLTDAMFHVVFCGYGFRNLDDKAKGVDEIKRVLKPGGQLLILDFFRPRRRLTQFFHQTYGKHLVPSVGKLISKSEGAYRYLYDSINNFYSISECVDLLKKKGFNSVSSKDFFMGISSVVSVRKARSYYP